MLLFIALTFLLCLVMTFALVAARSSWAAEPPHPEVPSAEPSRFFARPPAEQAAHDAALELLLIQLEHHIKLEEAAATHFLESPTPHTLHARTESPFRN